MNTRNRRDPWKRLLCGLTGLALAFSLLPAGALAASLPEVPPPAAGETGAAPTGAEPAQEPAPAASTPPALTKVTGGAASTYVDGLYTAYNGGDGRDIIHKWDHIPAWTLDGSDDFSTGVITLTYVDHGNADNEPSNFGVFLRFDGADANCGNDNYLFIGYAKPNSQGAGGWFWQYRLPGVSGLPAAGAYSVPVSRDDVPDPDIDNEVPTTLRIELSEDDLKVTVTVGEETGTLTSSVSNWFNGKWGSGTAVTLSEPFQNLPTRGKVAVGTIPSDYDVASGQQAANVTIQSLTTSDDTPQEPEVTDPISLTKVTGSTASTYENGVYTAYNGGDGHEIIKKWGYIPAWTLNGTDSFSTGTVTLTYTDMGNADRDPSNFGVFLRFDGTDENCSDDNYLFIGYGRWTSHRAGWFWQYRLPGKQSANQLPAGGAYSIPFDGSSAPAPAIDGKTLTTLKIELSENGVRVTVTVGDKTGVLTTTSSDWFGGRWGDNSTPAFLPDLLRYLPASGKVAVGTVPSDHNVTQGDHMAAHVAIQSLTVSDEIEEPADTKPVDPQKPVTWYVSSRNGSDENDGASAEHPFQTLTHLMEVLGEKGLWPGDRILLERGSVFADQWLHIRDAQGTAAQPIKIGAYGEGDLPEIQTNGALGSIWRQDFGVFKNDSGALQYGRPPSTAHVSSGDVSSCILLYDVEYLELSDIAMSNQGGFLSGEDHYTADRFDRTGVAGATQNIGTAEHIYLSGLHVHDIEGNVYNKHMANGGIYFIAEAPEALDGPTAQYDDLKIEDCLVENVSRTGISAAYTYQNARFHGKGVNVGIDDTAIRTYGSTNVTIRGNRIKNIGGDGIILMHSYRPLVEKNVLVTFATEMTDEYKYPSSYKNPDSFTKMENGMAVDAPAPRGNNVAAGIWPWECKNALFQYNECYDGKENGDGQAWDVDWSDGTVYQYNYSANNAGGAVMFCGTYAINAVFRYNISQNDGLSFDGPDGKGRKGVLDLAGNPNGAVYNNVFYIRDECSINRERSSGTTDLYNNIVYYAYAAGTIQDVNRYGWGASTTWSNNIYYNTENKPARDTGSIMGDPMLAAPGTGPDRPTDDLSPHDPSAFRGYMPLPGSPALQGGVQPTGIGVVEAWPLTTDFFGNEIADPSKPVIGVAEAVEPFTVTLDYNDGSTPALTVEVTPEGGSAAYTFGDDPTREGFTFDGWKDAADEAAQPTLYRAGDTVTLTGDVTFAAQWTEEPGGEVTPPPVTPPPVTPPPVTPPTVPDVTTGGRETEDGTVTETTAAPSSRISGGTARSTVSGAVGGEIVHQAQQNDSDAVVIAPKVSDSVDRVVVDLPGGTLRALGSGTGADLRVETPVGGVTIPNGALGALGAGSRAAVSVARKGDASEITVSVDGVPVESVPGGIRAALPVRDGEVAVLVGADGSETILPKSIVEDGVAYVALDGPATVKIVDNARAFADVTDAAWYAGAVRFASGHALFEGVGGGRFAPDRPMSRGMLATVLWRLERGKAAQGGADFSDVTADAWYADGVAWASGEGIILGNGDGTFAPDRSITREEMAAMLYRYAGALGLDVSGRATLDGFTDAGSVSGYARDAMSWAVSAGLIRGAEPDLLDPAGHATRAQVATVLQRMVRLITV